jgi:DNA mismatch repair protein MutS
MSAPPMMQQYQRAKSEQPDGLLFFRVGDFFELFYDDAHRASKLLGLTLTSRDKGSDAVPMAGVPARAVDQYLAKLVRLGEKAVLCDQVQDPKDAEGLIDRRITRVVTPGTLTEENALADRDHNYLAAASLGAKTSGVAYVDLSTGDFFAVDVATESALDLLHRIDPAEIVLVEAARDANGPEAELARALDVPLTTLPSWRFDPDEAARALKEHFGVATLDGFGVDDLRPGIGAAGAVLAYLKDTQRGAVSHVVSLRRPDLDGVVVLDRTTRASLELVRTLREGSREGSLLGVIDRTKTAPGGRLLKDWILEPLARADAIRARQAGVAALHDAPQKLRALRSALEKTHDVERLVARLSCGRGTARELRSLSTSLAVLPEVVASVAAIDAPVVREACARIPDLSDLVKLLDSAIVDSPPPAIKEGGMIRGGYRADLDELLSLLHDGKTWIATYQKEQIERTGIPNLKVAYNRVFGWFLEVTNTHVSKVPDDFIRKQTVKNAERYVTPALKEYEHKVAHAEEGANALELEIFEELRAATLKRLDAIKRATEEVAKLDALASLAQIALEWRGARPEIVDGFGVDVREGRHPVLIATPGAPPFTPNDLVFREDRRLLVVTGPNMAGKSTYIRQAALLVLLAQIGSYVPAASARIGVVDRVFTRVGASDELARGHSTFMVEMIETANILHHATERSLVILDEVGRGTSTFDGLALAWAIVEHLGKRVRCRGLFATHYHQLVELGATLQGCANLSVAVREQGEDVAFLHKIVEGGADRSFGIHVARIAGVPKPVLARAKEVLRLLEAQPLPALNAKKGADPDQLDLFAAARPGAGSGEAASSSAEPAPAPKDELRDALRAVDLDRITPFDALLLLRDLKDKATS